MSPAIYATCEEAVRVPRASGDEPGPGTSAHYVVECSPRERG